MRSVSLPLVLASVLLMGCTQGKNATGIPQTLNTASLAPSPTQGQQGQLTNQLDRYIGQTDFLTLSYGQRLAGLESARSAAFSDKSAAPGRAEQESDVFKVGLPGSKLLYLLNSSRGLQVVSFAQGADNPQLIGRVNPTGNGSDTLYSDLERGRLMVIENIYQGQNHNSRIVVYNVKDPSKPVIADVVEVEGRVMDSRIVGDVLYVATYSAEQQASRWGWGAQRPSNGKVASYNLKGEKIVKVQDQALQLPIARGELMNIQNQGDKYYLIGVQSENSWLWWDRQSAVEVIDISSPTGEIKPAMTVIAKGTIRERSQTHIHNGFLVVTSNYIVHPNDRNRVARVAVEAYKLPGAEPEVITEDEAEYRRLHIERALKKAPEGEAEALREKLLADAELGLKGRFISLKNGSLRKLVADSAVTSGDTTGLSASLQDVRYQDDLLYAFWVPANMADPLDVFSLADLEKGVKYEGRLEYDGWIARSFPVSYKGRKFILGLGWIVENVNNEQQRRYPQALILEVKKGSRRVRDRETGVVSQIEAVVLEKVPGAQVTMKSTDHVWANLNSVDREIELRMDSDSQGEILFPAYKWGKGFTEGGQIIRFDLEEAFQGLGDTSLAVGPFLAAPQGWLRRVFNNSEIGMVNAFSSESLATFSTAGVRSAQTSTAVSVLELARNVSDYHTLKNKTDLKGVQVISRGNYPNQETVLRLVEPKLADAEKPAVQDEAVLPGNVVASARTEGGASLLVLTSKTDDSSGKYATTYTLARVRLSAGQGFAVELKTWVDDKHGGGNNGRAFWRGSQSAAAITVLAGGKILISTGGQVQMVEEGKALSPRALSTKACPENSQLKSVQFKEISGRLVFVVSESFAERELASVQRKSVVFANLDGQTLKCGAAVNIPGEPVLLAGDSIVTQDQYSKDTQETYEEYEQRDGNGELKKVRYEVLRTLPAYGYTLVQVKAGVAVLADLTADLNSSYGVQTGTVLPGLPKIHFVYSSDQNRGGSAEFATLQIENGRLVTSVYPLVGVDDAYASLVSLVQVRPDELLAVVTGGGASRIYHVEADRRPVAVSFKPVLEDGRLGAPSERLEGYVYGKVHYTPEQNSVEISAGLRGVIQLFL